MKTSDVLKDIIRDLISSITASSEGEDIMNKLVNTYGEVIKKETIEELKMEEK